MSRRCRQMLAETEAVALLAGLGEGQLRNILQGPDQVSATGEVTRDRVRTTFKVGYADVLIEYGQANRSRESSHSRRFSSASVIGFYVALAAT